EDLSMAVRIAIAIAAALCVPTIANADCSLERRIFAVPMWAHSPNEGNTWGLMPIWMAVCPDDKRMHWILAPSGSWNAIVHWTGPGRWFSSPDEDSPLKVIGSASTRFNYRAIAEWQHLPLETWAWTHEASGRVERSAFYRFFGIGPDTDASDETSYVGLRM